MPGCTAPRLGISEQQYLQKCLLHRYVRRVKLLMLKANCTIRNKEHVLFFVTIALATTMLSWYSLNLKTFGKDHRLQT